MSNNKEPNAERLSLLLATNHRYFMRRVVTSLCGCLILSVVVGVTAGIAASGDTTAAFTLIVSEVALAVYSIARSIELYDLHNRISNIEKKYIKSNQLVNK